MMNRLQEKFTPPAFLIYRKLFREEMSGEVKKFFKNLSYVGSGTAVGIVFSFAFNVLAGRILGPGGYGEYTLIQSVAMFLCVPMTLGVSTAMIKYNAEKEDWNRQSSIISTAYVLVFCLVLASLTAYFIFSPAISALFSVPAETYYLSVAFAVIFVFQRLANDTLKGLHEMKKYALSQPLYSILLFLAFLYFLAEGHVSFKSMLYSTYFAYLATGAVIIFFIRNWLKPVFDTYWAGKMTKYGGLALIGGLSFVLYTNIDAVLINAYMSVEDVGIYRAYHFASINVTAVLFNMFNTVFFPLASKCEDKRAIFKKINRGLPYLIGAGFPLIVVCEAVILSMYGGGYPLDPVLALSFAAVSLLIAFYSVYDWTFCSEGIRGVKLVNISTVVIAVMNITLNVCLIPTYGLIGAITATAAAFLLGICCLLSFRRRITWTTTK